MKLTCEMLQHAVLMTEGVCTPNFARGRMSEVLFECYGAPKVAYAIDALLAYEYNAFAADLAVASSLTSPWTGSAASGLIVRVGHASSHVMPVYIWNLHLDTCIYKHIYIYIYIFIYKSISSSCATPTPSKFPAISRSTSTASTNH